MKESPVGIARVICTCQRRARRRSLDRWTSEAFFRAREALTLIGRYTCKAAADDAQRAAWVVRSLPICGPLTTNARQFAHGASGNTAFLFTGRALSEHGWGSGFTTRTSFSDTVLTRERYCSNALRSDVRLTPIRDSERAEQDMTRLRIGQQALFRIEYSLVNAERMGVTQSIMLGHESASVAATLAGIFT